MNLFDFNIDLFHYFPFYFKQKNIKSAVTEMHDNTNTAITVVGNTSLLRLRACANINERYVLHIIIAGVPHISTCI